MVKTIVDLSKEEETRVRTYMGTNNIKSKEEAIKHIVRTDLENEVKNLDPKLNTEDKSFKSALVLITSLRVGTDMKQVCNFLNFKYDKTMKDYEKNLIKNKIWVKDKLAINWFDEKEGGIAFWMDVLAMEGLVERTNEKTKK